MDFFKGIGDFFGGLFGKKKKQEEMRPVQETSSISWQPPKQMNGLGFQADLGSTQFKPEKLSSNVDYSRNSLNPIPNPKKTDSTDFSKDDTSGLNLDFSGKNKTTGNRFTMGNGSSLGNIAVHEDDINSTIKQLNDRYHNERDSLGRFWGSFIGDTDRRDRELRHKIIQNEMKKITDGVGYNQDGTYKRDYTDDEAYKMAALQLAERHGIDGAPIKSFMPSISVDKKPVNAKTFEENTLATANTIKNMTDGEDGLGGIIGNILFGKKKQDDGFNLGRFLVDLPAGMVSGAVGIGAGVTDALSGKRMQRDGTIKDLNTLQRLGAGSDAAISAFGLPAGASGALARSLFKNGAKQAVKEIGKTGLKAVAKDLAKGALSEGVEEGVQQIAQNLSSQGNYDENGNLKVEKLVDGVVEATALGTLGGGIMGGASLGINAGKVKLGEIHQKVRSKIDENVNPADNPVQNAVLKVEANKNITERFKNAYVDGRLPIPQTTITPNAGIKNRIETSFENGLTGDFGNGRDWVGRLKQNDIAMANDIQTATNRKLLNQNGDIYLDNYNAAEHAQKRFSENPELNTPKHLTDTAYNALFGDGRQILPNNPSNPNSVAFINKNDPTGFVSVGEGRSGNNELFTVVPSRRRELDSFESKNSLNKQGTPTEIGAIDTIPQPLNDVKNGNDSNDNIKYKLTPEQEEFFRNSKIRDENGTTQDIQSFSEQNLRKIIGNEYDIISKASDNAPRTAQGYVDLKNGIVAILDGKMSTANHEATHIAVNALNTANPKLANSAIDGIVKQYGADNLVSEANKAGYDQILGHKLDMNNVDDVRYAAEERLANDFAKYAEAKVKGRENYYVKKNSIPAQIKAWFDTVIDHLKDMVGRLDSAHDFMYRLERGDFADLIDQQMRVNYSQDNNVLTTRPQMAYRIDPETNIVHIENDILHGVSPKNRAKVISQYFKDNYQGNNYELNFGKDGAARISAKSRNKYLDPNQSISELILKGKMTGELPDILKVSQKIGEAPDTKNHSFARDGFEYRQSFVQIGDDLYSVKLNVGINDNGKLFYTINGIKKAPESHYRDLSGGNTYNISQDTDNVKMKLEDIEDLENPPKDAGRKNANSTETAQEEMGGQIQPENKAKNDGNPTRKFIETVLENAPPKDFRQAVEESNGKGKYNVRNTESLWKQAVEEVAKDPLGAFKDIEDARSDKAIAKGIALAEYFKAQGDNASSSAVYIKLAERATEAGRKVQALSLIKKSTPEGMLMNISRQIDAYNNLQDKRGRFAKDKIILDDQTRAYWYQRLQEIYEMPTKTKEQERTKKIAMGQFNKEVSKFFPSKKWDKTMAIWKAGLLSAPTTHIRNIVGNTANLIGETASNIISVPTDFVASKFTGIRSTTFKGTKGYGRGLAEGLKTAGDIMRTGVDTSGDVIAKYDSKDVHFDSKLGKGAQAYADTIFRALNAADKPFKQGMFESSIDSQAYAMAKNKGLEGKEAKAYAEKLIKNPTVEMQEAATIDAEMATFQQPTALGNAIRGAKNKGGNVGKALDVLTPFTQVPSAVADQAVNYSPLGLVKAVKQFGDVKKAINAGLSEAQIMQLQRKAVKQTGRFFTGATLIGAGVILAKNGMLSGAAKDNEERRQWQAEGKMENAVKIGNDWFSLDSIAPELLILNAGGQLYKDLKNSNDISATLAKSGLNVAKQFTEQSYMTGLKSGLDAVTDPEQSVGKLFGSLATSAIPNAVKKGAQALDDKQRQVNSLEDSLKASIPGLRNTLPQKYDVYGRPMQSDMDFLETLFSPVKRTSIKENNLTNSIDALREKDSDYDKIIPNRPPKTVKIGDKNHTLTAEESSEYQRLMGELTSKYMQVQGFNDESFKKLSDDDKVKILTNIKTDVKSAVENHLFNNKNPKKMGDNKKIISRSLSGGQTADPVWQTKEEKKEDLYTRKEAEYEKFKREYDEKLAKGEYSRRGKIEAEGRLKKLEVGKNFMKETRDLYELGKRDFKKLIKTAEDGEKVLKEVLAYGDALAKAGIEKNKFRDKYGNVKLDSERGGSRERSSGGGTPSYKMDTMALIRGALDYSKSGGVATKSYGRKSAARANTREVKRLSGKVNFSRK